MAEINFNDYAIKLSAGKHSNPQNGLCVMECVAYIQGEFHTDHPVCACPVITTYCMGINDKFDQAVRDRLLAYILRIAGSKATLEIEHKRAFLCADYAVRIFSGIKDCPKIVNKKTALIGEKLAASYAASYAADAASYAAAYNTVYATDAATDAAVYAASYADATLHLKNEIFNLLEDMLALSEPVEFTPVIETKLHELENL